MAIDSKGLPDQDGFEINAYLMPDDYCTPADFDCYDADQVRAFNAGDWQFVVMVVEAGRRGIRLGYAALGGCEYGFLPGVEGWVSPFDTDYLSDLVDEAVADARRNLAAIVAEDQVAS